MHKEKDKTPHLRNLLKLLSFLLYRKTLERPSKQPIKEPSIEQAVVEESGKQTDVQAQAPAADIPAKKKSLL